VKPSEFRQAVLKVLTECLDAGYPPLTRDDLRSHLGHRYPQAHLGYGVNARLLRLVKRGVLVAFRGGRGNGVGYRYMPANYLENLTHPKIAADRAEELGKTALARYLRTVGSYRDGRPPTQKA